MMLMRRSPAVSVVLSLCGEEPEFMNESACQNIVHVKPDLFLRVVSNMLSLSPCIVLL